MAMPFYREETAEPKAIEAEHILLCADSSTLASPELIGLTNVTLDRLEWLHLCSTGLVARELLARTPSAYREVWVVSADDIDGINIAAALVHDHPRLPVYLVSERPSGSLRSRAQSAGITATLTLPIFAERFERACEVGKRASRTSFEPVPAPLAEQPFSVPAANTVSTPMPAGGVAAYNTSPSAFSERNVAAFGIPREGASSHGVPASSAAPFLPSIADPDPFESDSDAERLSTDQALRLSIERLRAIRLGPDSPRVASQAASTPQPASATPMANPRQSSPSAAASTPLSIPQPSVPNPMPSSQGNPAQDADFAAARENPATIPSAAAISRPQAPDIPRSQDENRPPAPDQTALIDPAPPTPVRRTRADEPKVVTTPACVQTALRPMAAKKRRPAAANGFLISVLSGSGGAGKSTIAALTAARIARKGLRVAIIDCDLQFGDIASAFGLRDAPRVDQVLEEGSLESFGAPKEGAPFVIAAPGHVEQSETVDIERLLDIVLPRFDVVVANTGAGWGDVHAYLMENSARVLFVVDQRASSVRACLHGLDLCRRCGIASGSFLYVLNRCSKVAPFTSIDLSCALKGASVAELREGGMEVEEMLASGMAMELADEANPIVDSIAEMLGLLLPDRLAALAQARKESVSPSRGRSRKKASRRARRRAENRLEERLDESY